MEAQERQGSGDDALEVDAYGPVYPLTKQIQAMRKVRVCLHCNQSFLSCSPGHRFCSWCKRWLRLADDERSREDPNEEYERPIVRGRVRCASPVSGEVGQYIGEAERSGMFDVSDA